MSSARKFREDTEDLHSQLRSEHSSQDRSYRRKDDGGLPREDLWDEARRQEEHEVMERELARREWAECWMTRLGSSILFAFFLSSLILPFAFGDQVIQSLQKAAPAQKKKRDCGLSCRYYQANDNLTFQALYLTEKLGKIDDAIKKGNDADAEKAMGAFCRSGEGASDCFTRYKSFHGLALTRIRQAIGNNEDAIAMLTSNRQYDGSVSGPASQIGTELEAEIYTPDVPTLSELEKEYRSNGKLAPGQRKKVSHAEVAKWSQELVNPNPDEKFHEFKSKPVAANPSRPEEKRNLTMRERDKAGAFREDAKVRTYVSAQEQELKKANAGGPSNDPAVDVLSPTEIKSGDVISYESLQSARTQMISAVQKSITQTQGTAGSSSTDVKNTPTQAKYVGDEEKVKKPAESRTNSYLRYDLSQLLSDIQDATR